MADRQNNILRIALTGPESTGKSWLAKRLADYYHTVWVPEFAREYLEKKNGQYGFEDILQIAKGQKQSEKQLIAKANRLIFTDTESIVTKIWSEVVFGRCDPWIQEEIKNHPYDLYLLCYPDLPWEPDPLRENPDNREELFRLYKQELETRRLPFSIIRGMGQERLQKAIQAVENILPE